jgi:hypothetical protein
MFTFLYETVVIGTLNLAIGKGALPNSRISRGPQGGTCPCNLSSVLNFGFELWFSESPYRPSFLLMGYADRHPPGELHTRTRIRKCHRRSASSLGGSSMTILFNNGRYSFSRQAGNYDIVCIHLLYIL